MATKDAIRLSQIWLKEIHSGTDACAYILEGKLKLKHNE